MELSREEERAYRGEEGPAEEAAYRILVAAGEAAGAGRLVPVEWAHLSGVNYNTIGEAGRDLLAELAAQGARARVKATLNPMGYDRDSVGRYGLGGEFVAGQEAIRESYAAMGVEPTFSCVPYELFAPPAGEAQVAFAESNAAIYANSLAGMRTNREGALGALASAITGKSPHSELREPDRGGAPESAVVVDLEGPTEVDYGLLGLFAGRAARGSSVAIAGAGEPDARCRKALCGGMGTAGTCARFALGDAGGARETVRFGREEARAERDGLDTAERGDVIVLGSPQLGLPELAGLASMLEGRRFSRRCMVFCPRAAKEQAARLGHARALERAGCELLADCCACLTPLVGPGEVDAVTTNSVKGAYYLNGSTGVGVSLRPLSEIVAAEAVPR